MKITKQHRECFKEALRYIETTTSSCYTAIQFTKADPLIKTQCGLIFFHYFPNNEWFEIISPLSVNQLTSEKLFTCRLIALYTLIYAPL